MTPARAELRRIRPAAAAVAGWLAFAVTVHGVVTRPQVHPAWFTGLVLTTTAVALTWCLLDALLRTSRGRGPSALVVSSVGLMAMVPYATHATDRQLPPLLHVVLAGMVLAPTALPARGSAAVGTFLVVGLTFLRQPALGTLAAVVESLQLFVVIGVQIVLWTMLKRAVDATHASAAVRWTAEKEAARAAYRERESERWDALIHDKVLGALQFAVHGRTEPASSLAREALATLAQETSVRSGASDLRVIAQTWGRRLDLQVAVDVEGDERAVDPQVWDVVRGIMTEALVNVARHSGQSIAWIDGHVRADSLRLVVGDPGRGFDPGDLGSRAGLRLGRARIESFGGSLSVASLPRRGTRVTVTWEAAPAPDLPPGPWSPDIVRTMFLLGCGVLALCGVGGLSVAAHSRSTAVGGLGLVLIALLTVGVAVAPRTTATLASALVGLVLTTGMLAADVAAPYTPDWRWWFVGALTTALAVVVLRWGTAAGALLGSGVTVAMVLGHALGSGGHDWTGALPFVPQLVMTAAVAAIVRRGLERSERGVREAEALAARADIAAAAADARTREFARRAVDTSRAAGSVLEQIADAHVPSEAERALWGRLEGRIRDQLVAGAVLTPVTVAAVEAARDRGVVVEVVDHGAAGLQQPLAFEALCVPVLASAGSGARVTAIWRPTIDGHLATVVIEGRHGVVEWADLDGRTVESLVDHDASLYTLLGTAVPSAGDKSTAAVLDTAGSPVRGTADASSGRRRS